MPIYTYRCQACENVVEKRQSFADAPLTTCETCGGELRKLIHPAGIVFKGSGFYNTDYRGNGAAKTPEPATSEGGDGAKADASGGAGDAKPDAKTDTAAAPKSDAATPAATSGAKTD